jgi:hypothetical protein
LKKFPKTIYVTREDAGTDDEWLTTNEDVPDVEFDTPVGIYQLVEAATIVVTREVKKQELKR